MFAGWATAVAWVAFAASAQCALTAGVCKPVIIIVPIIIVFHTFTLPFPYSIAQRKTPVKSMTGVRFLAYSSG